MTDLTKRDPFAKLFSWPRWMEDFEDFGSQRGLKIHETEKDIIAEAVVAGVPANEIEIHIEDGVLTIRAEKADKSSSFQYYYTAALSGGQWDKADADIEHGVVRVTIPKTEAVRPRKITVKQRGKDK